MNPRSEPGVGGRKPASAVTASMDDLPFRRALAGLVIKRECWCLSVRGKFACLLLVLVCLGALRQGLLPFLAVSQRASTEALVLEGWIPAYVVNQVARQVTSGEYNRIIIARPLYAGKSEYESGAALASYVKESLIGLGIPRERIHIVYSAAVDRDRTYSSALAVRNWFKEQGLDVRTIDVGTMGAHARRSRLLFQRAFGKDIKVGVIAFEDQDYDQAHWWRSSAGVREIPFELIAYIYVKFFFSTK